MFRTGPSLAAFLIVALASGNAAGQGICVECKGPDQTYRCTIKDSEKVQHVRGASRATEFVCITEIARSGGHQSCRVGSGYSGPCIGQNHEIDLSKLPPASTTSHPVPDALADEKPGASATGPPQTLEELARNTMSKSKEQIGAADESVRKAGGAVGGTFKKTWDCVASLFSRC